MIPIFNVYTRELVALYKERLKKARGLDSSSDTNFWLQVPFLEDMSRLVSAHARACTRAFTYTHARTTCAKRQSVLKTSRSSATSEICTSTLGSLRRVSTLISVLVCFLQTLDIIGKAAFGYEFHSTRDQDNPISKAFERMVSGQRARYCRRYFLDCTRWCRSSCFVLHSAPSNIEVRPALCDHKTCRQRAEAGGVLLWWSGIPTQPPNPTSLNHRACPSRCVLV